MDLAFRLVLLGFTLVAARFLWNYLRSPLKSFPGPLAARFTNLWRLQDVFKGRCDITHNQLHRKHGSAVCVGPNVLSLSDPALIGRVYTTRDPWIKASIQSLNAVDAS
ncbi:Benzoate 4-monooxygenase cytochrome P450 [Aspergillus sp. HF37]|nr:Benzoate 4-monooxygenase cytochrome P450 [Aspergillus sp. HF37]